MKSIQFSLLLLSIGQVQAFTPTTQFTVGTSISTKESTTTLNALTAQDILERARKSAGVEEEPEPEPIFNDGILNDFQQSLLLMEKRVKQGPSSLSSMEVQNLEIMLSRIVSDMKAYDAAGGAVPGIAAAPSAAASINAPTPPPPQQEMDPPYVHEHNPEEGSKYDGKGGLGLAKGTANTYIIDGMDEMSPEEYRKKLQESISGRQQKRRSSGQVGNLMSNNYLNNLNRND